MGPRPRTRKDVDVDQVSLRPSPFGYHVDLCRARLPVFINKETFSFPASSTLFHSLCVRVLLSSSPATIRDFCPSTDFPWFGLLDFSRFFFFCSYSRSKNLNKDEIVINQHYFRRLFRWPRIRTYFPHALFFTSVRLFRYIQRTLYFGRVIRFLCNFAPTKIIQ